MKPTYLLLVVILAIAAAAVKALTKGARNRPFATKRKPVMTKNEQPMYWRLRETFPEHVVLAQVAFSALITSAREHRNRYDRKVADFVLLDRAMTVIAVIELDDSSHQGREAQDSVRTAILESAGLKVIRFPRTPDIEQLRAAVAATANES